MDTPPVIKRVGPMHNPPHPGEILKEDILVPLGISVTNAAAALGVTRKTVSELLNGHSGISPEMALRISQATGTTAESWLAMQTAYDLWQMRKKAKRLKVKKLVAA